MFRYIRQFTQAQARLQVHRLFTSNNVCGTLRFILPNNNCVGIVQEQGPQNTQFVQPAVHLRSDLTEW